MTLWTEMGRRLLSRTDDEPAGPVLASTTELIDGSNWPGAGSSVHLFTDDVSGLVRSVPYTTIYQTNPWLWAVVQLKARSFSRMPPKVFRREGTLDVRAYEGRGAQLEQRLRKPGGGVSWQARQKATMIDYQVTGNALWIINSDRAGINGFDLVPWSTIRVQRDSTTGDVFYAESSTTIEWDGVTTSDRRWPEQQVIHFGFGENPGNPYRNPSPIGSLQATLALFDAVYQQVLNFFNNGARPSAHFKIDRATDPAVLSAVTTSIREAMAGTKNAGKVFVSPGDYQPITSGPDQTRVIELAKQSREEICGVFGVAPPLVGILERAIFSNVRELRNFTMRDTVGPDVELIAGAITSQVSFKRPVYNGITVDFEAAAQLKPDLEAIADTLPNQLRITTPNELRGKFNLPPLDDPAADQIWNPQRADDTPTEQPTEENQTDE